MNPKTLSLFQLSILCHMPFYPPNIPKILQNLLQEISFLDLYGFEFHEALAVQDSQAPEPYRFLRLSSCSGPLGCRQAWFASKENARVSESEDRLEASSLDYVLRQWVRFQDMPVLVGLITGSLKILSQDRARVCRLSLWPLPHMSSHSPFLRLSAARLLILTTSDARKSYIQISPYSLFRVAFSNTQPKYLRRNCESCGQAQLVGASDVRFRGVHDCEQSEGDVFM